MISAKKQIGTSVLSFLLSFLASSHHWLHMGRARIKKVQFASCRCKLNFHIYKQLLHQLVHGS